VLSCWSIHRFSRHTSGLFFLTASRRRCITSRISRGLQRGGDMRWKF
jgi:hypothetical protein